MQILSNFVQLRVIVLITAAQHPMVKLGVNTPIVFFALEYHIVLDNIHIHMRLSNNLPWLRGDMRWNFKQISKQTPKAKYC